MQTINRYFPIRMYLKVRPKVISLNSDQYIEIGVWLSKHWPIGDQWEHYFAIWLTTESQTKHNYWSHASRHDFNSITLLIPIL